MESRFRHVVVGPILDALFPRFCLRCKREGTLWCQSCAEAYLPKAPRTCPFCCAETGGRICGSCQDGSYLDGLMTLGSYADPVLREAIGVRKYSGDAEAMKPMIQLIRSSASRLERFSSFTVSWVPLHAARKRERGFDQAEDIAQEVARTIDAPCRCLSVRVVKTAPQAKRRDRRVGEMDGAFRALGPVPSAVLLCDDVFTSGATMDAAAKALKEAGASLVWGFALARGSLK